MVGPTIAALTRSEIRRLLVRRAFRGLVALVVVSVGAAGFIVYLRGSADTPSALARANRLVESCEREHLVQAGASNAVAVEIGCPTVEDAFLSFDRRFWFADAVPTATRQAGLALIAASFLFGVWIMGSDWSSGAMAALFTWEPRRGRVLLARSTLAGVVAASFGTLTLFLVSAALVPAGKLRGTMAGTEGRWWLVMAGVWLTLGVVAGVAAVLGAALANMLRNQTGPIGVSLMYLIAVEPLLGLLGSGSLNPWLLRENFMRVVDVAMIGPLGIRPSTDSILRSTLLLTGYCALAVALSHRLVISRDAT